MNFRDGVEVPTFDVVEETTTYFLPRDEDGENTFHSHLGLRCIRATGSHPSNIVYQVIYRMKYEVRLPMDNTKGLADLRKQLEAENVTRFCVQTHQNSRRKMLMSF